MSGASLDRVLGLLVAAVVATGFFTLRAGVSDAAWVFVGHDLLAGALAAAVVLKLRRSVRRAVDARRWVRLVLGLGLSFAVIAALTGGYLWVVSAGLPSVGGWTVLTIHAWFGLALVPVLVVHLGRRRWRLLEPGPNAVALARRRLLTRRSFLIGSGFATVAIGASVAVNALDRWRGGMRRFTGSRFVSLQTAPPATTFAGDSTQIIDPARWRLRVHGRVARALELTLADLAALGGSELVAVLDCTSGWAVQASWQGVAASALLAAAGAEPEARNVVVRSVTGWSTVLPISEARQCLFATAVSGQQLPAANGAPCRLVVPSRRGLDWIKWVDEVELT